MLNIPRTPTLQLLGSSDLARGTEVWHLSQRSELWHVPQIRGGLRAPDGSSFSVSNSKTYRGFNQWRKSQISGMEFVWDHVWGSITTNYRCSIFFPEIGSVIMELPIFQWMIKRGTPMEVSSRCALDPHLKSCRNMSHISSCWLVKSYPIPTYPHHISYSLVKNLNVQRLPSGKLTSLLKITTFNR